MTEGSRFLEELILDDDPRTLDIQTWGGTNTTARALKSIQERYEGTAEWPPYIPKRWTRIMSSI